MPKPLPIDVSVSQPIEKWAEEKRTPAWLFAAAKAITPAWGVGREVTEQQFDDVIHRAGHLEMRPG